MAGAIEATQKTHEGRKILLRQAIDEKSPPKIAEVFKGLSTREAVNLFFSNLQPPTSKKDSTLFHYALERGAIDCVTTLMEQLEPLSSRMAPKDYQSTSQLLLNGLKDSTGHTVAQRLAQLQKRLQNKNLGEDQKTKTHTHQQDAPPIETMVSRKSTSTSITEGLIQRRTTTGRASVCLGDKEAPSEKKFHHPPSSLRAKIKRITARMPSLRLCPPQPKYQKIMGESTGKTRPNFFRQLVGRRRKNTSSSQSREVQMQELKHIRVGKQD